MTKKINKKKVRINKKRILKENKIFRQALIDTLWMANRYSFNRNSYAPSMFKDAFEKVKNLLPESEIKKIENDIVIKEQEEFEEKQIKFRKKET